MPSVTFLYTSLVIKANKELADYRAFAPGAMLAFELLSHISPNKCNNTSKMKYFVSNYYRMIILLLNCDHFLYFYISIAFE